MFARFCLVGGVGFIIDYGLTATIILADSSPFTARLFSIAIAMMVTWRLNRAITFKAGTHHQSREGLRYFIVAASAAYINYCAYSVLLINFPHMPLIFAIALSTAISMIVSYTGFSRFAFRLVDGDHLKDR